MSRPWELRLFYDGACPLCAREIRFLARRDHRYRIDFVDISAPGFDAAQHGLDGCRISERIHGKLPGGETIEGLEVFRRAYATAGIGWLLAPTRWPGLAGLSDRAYELFARNRLRWTGRTRDCSCASRSRSEPTSSARRPPPLTDPPEARRFHSLQSRGRQKGSANPSAISSA